ncbi:DUF7661 family protein [Pseudoalteromonas rubra]|uniref:DUF7661 domain-containing protein n=1 Tax=Pseudoalteromonas rubra TaxID=43658 RepID=A0A0F4QU34_9GAMM|nr:hypothetical protein [Pseudoalteromonas rubra]KJZ10122.1 hypothetical protein TW77_07725 [Pseudoalteromonas rubra]RZM72781.1 hypothetical protein C3B51_21605 [Pseudoalteromonas rubra]TMP36038.1 hypothetical protein CWB98_14925 [Pseudoalteromonas rubra]
MTLRFNVFGKRMSVSRIGAQWQLFIDSDTGIRARVYDVVIPPELDDGELAKYLDDIYHELSCERYPRVTQVD